MTIGEILPLILAPVETLLPCVYVVLIATSGLLIPLNLMGRRTWVNQRSFGWLGLFFELSFLDMVRLACAWIRMLTAIAFLCSWQMLEQSQYLFFIILSCIQALTSRQFMDVVGKLFWATLQIMGLLSASLICGYLVLLEAPAHYWVAYSLLCIFMILFSIYLFLLDVNTVSLGRSANIAKYSKNKQNT